MTPIPSRSDNLPPITVVLGPARSGKTRWCLERLCANPRDVWLIVDAGCRRIRARAQAMGVPADLAKRRVLDSDGLLDALDQAAPARRRISQTLQRLFLADAIAAACRPDGPFFRVCHKRGFVARLRSAIRELKLARATPRMLRTAGALAAGTLQDPEFDARLRELSEIWAAYDALLAAHQRCDDEDRVADAAARLAEGRALRPQSLIVDGRRKIEPLWRRLLAELARASCEVAITLPDDPERPQLFASTARTLDGLAEDFEVRIHRLDRRPDPAVAPALAHLERGIFGRSQRLALPALDDSPLALFDAPSPYAEAEMVGRELLRRRREGLPWSRCAILVRSADIQGPVVATVLQEKYGIPVALRLRKPLAEHPAVQTLLALFALFSHDWRRADLVRYLKSAYCPVDRLAADLLRRKLHRKPVYDGRAAWHAADPAALTRSETLQRHIRALLQWDARLVAAEKPASAWAGLVREMLPEAIHVDRRDTDAHNALHAVQGLLEDIAAASELHNEGPIPFATFAERAAAQAEIALYHSGPPERDTDVVELLEPDDAHGLEVDWCAVMGMTERVFPKRISEDPFLRDDERVALAAAGGPRLALRQQEADDERLRFYMAAATPARRLILSFARANEEQDVLPSFYLDDVRSLYEHVPALVATLAEVVPEPGRAATDHESLLAECSQAAEGGARSVSEACAAILSTRSVPAYPRMEDEDRLARIARQRRFGLAQLEAYLECPFRLVASSVLKLREDTNGTSPAERGNVYHRVLERTMRRHHGTEPSAEQLRDALRSDLADVLAEAAIDAPPHHFRLMERALRDAVDGFAQREVRYRSILGGTPAHYELSFGQSAAQHGEDDDAGEPDAVRARTHDPASTPAPLVVADDGAGAPIEVAGTIDRVDLLPGRRAVVIDYKMGHGVGLKQMDAGESLQMPVYLLAIERLWGYCAAIACYDSVRDGARSRIFRRNAVDNPQALRPIAEVEDGRTVRPLTDDQYSSLVQTAEDAVRRAAAGLRAGDIVPRPGPHCDTCAYQDLCRTSTAREHDGEELPALPTIGRAREPAPVEGGDAGRT